MVKTQIAIIIALGAFAAGGFVMSPVPQAIAAVIATDVQCTGCVGTADLGGNAITSGKIKDGEVRTDDIAVSAIGSARIKDDDIKAQDLAPESVGASEIVGVTKLIFADCTIPTTFDVPAGSSRSVTCSVPNYTQGDRVVATEGGMFFCFEVTYAGGGSAGNVSLTIRNECSSTQNLSGSVGLIVFHT